jgi:hypothetical protein
MMVYFLTTSHHDTVPPPPRDAFTKYSISLLLYWPPLSPLVTAKRDINQFLMIRLEGTDRRADWKKIPTCMKPER